MRARDDRGKRQGPLAQLDNVCAVAGKRQPVGVWAWVSVQLVGGGEAEGATHALLEPAFEAFATSWSNAWLICDECAFSFTTKIRYSAQIFCAS